ncbi:alpha/beta hydrolase [Tautonia marina]|uniref:alpha/beta hydrolase n=1 Tax=Tautonia marina TaxID=2653855 RepID=UPI001260A84B|nr:alpha/beta hydrolase [Tautonia marina]
MASIPVPVFPTPDDLTLPCPGGSNLKAWHWRSPQPRAILLISHGLGEHAGLYRALAEYLVATLDIDVLGVDFQGHGRSPGRRGHLARYEQLIDNLESAILWAKRVRPGLPRFLLGHSNGGVVAAQTVLRLPLAVDGLILSNPAIQLKYQPPWHKLAVGHTLRLLAPWITINGALPIEDLSRDPLQQLQLASDRLIHTRVGAPLFFGMLNAGQNTLERASEFQLPLLLILGPDDPIIDPDTGRAFYDRYGGSEKTLLAPPGFRHDPLFEKDRGLIYQGLASWILTRCLAPRPFNDTPDLADSSTRS